MVKVDYILLSRHFRGETTEEENAMILLWIEQNIVNTLTYQRQKKAFLLTNDADIKEIQLWKEIMGKIVEEL